MCDCLRGRINHQANDMYLLKLPSHPATTAISENMHDDNPFILFNPMRLPEHKTT